MCSHKVAPFDFIPFSDVCKLSDDDSNFKEELDQADRIDDTQDPEEKTWFPEDVDETDATYYYVEHIGEPLTETEFAARFKKRPLVSNTRGIPTTMLPKVDGSPGEEKNWIFKPSTGPSRLLHAVRSIGGQRRIHYMTPQTHRIKSQGSRTLQHVAGKSSEPATAIQNASMTVTQLNALLNGCDVNAAPASSKAQEAQSSGDCRAAAAATVSFGQAPSLSTTNKGRLPSFQSGGTSSQSVKPVPFSFST
jgi:hypothetical protein